MHKVLGELVRHKLLGYDNKRADGFRLTTSGYDFLASGYATFCALLNHAMPLPLPLALSTVVTGRKREREKEKEKERARARARVLMSCGVPNRRRPLATVGPPSCVVTISADVCS